MRTSFARIAFAAALQIFAVGMFSAQAQAPAFPTLQTPPSKIMIDGDVKEWGDSLQYYNKENKINYAIANDKENLYMAMRIKDRVQQIRALNAGITFSIDTKGKKRDSFRLTFPLPMAGTSDFNFHAVNEGPVNQKDRDQLTRDRAFLLRGIKVEGFKEIDNGLLPGSDDHGITAAINYDQHGYLVCEVVIPLKNFHVDDLYKNEWAFNIQVNGIARPAAPAPDAGDAGQANSGGRGGGRSGGSSSNRGSGNLNSSATASFANGGPSVYYRSDDFWVKFFLAK
jgi:hypothetical protein